jgi:ribosomal protein S18 acetylase RimI-like enzyme
LLEPEQLELIRPLWEALCDFHTTVPNAFAPTIIGRPFEPRQLEFCRMAAEGRLRIEIASAAGNNTAHDDTAHDDTVADKSGAGDSVAEGNPIAYCVTRLSADGEGEVESLYVAPEFRRRGIAARLVRAALDWLTVCGAESRRVIVFHGNDEASAFYARVGFRPRNVEWEI